jgi:hyperosmotically inducible protein
MMAKVKTSKVALMTALLGLALAGCDRGAEQTGAADSSSTATPPASTAGTAGSTTATPPSPPSSTAGTTPSTPPSADAGAGSAAGTSSGTTGAAGSSAGTTGSAAGTTDSATAPPPTGASGSAPGTPSDSSTSSSGASGSASGASDSSGASSAAAKAGSVIDDTVITTKVKTALMADNEIKGTDINVETDKGEVMLSGFVGDQTQIDKAVKVANAVEGVKKVENKMSVKK